MQKFGQIQATPKTAEIRHKSVMLPALQLYSRTPVTQTLKGDEKLFELAGVRVIGVDKKFDFSCK